MQRRRTDGKSVGKSGIGSSVAVSSVVGASGSKALDLKDKKEKQEVVVAALSVISNATNKHLLQQADTQNAARAIAMNLEEPVVVEKIWEKKGLSTLITSLQRVLQYLRDARGASTNIQALTNVNSHLHRSLWALTAHGHFAKMAVRHNLADIILECLEIENRKKTPFFDCDKPNSGELTTQLAILYNLSSQVENQEVLNSLGVVSHLIPAIRSPSLTAQGVASLTVLNLVVSEDMCNKVAEAGALEAVILEIQNCIDGVQSAVEWDVMELLQALFKLSTSEANKEKLVNAGALPVLVRLLSEGHERVKIFSLRCLWSLSFHPNNKFHMQCEPLLINHLNSHSSHVNPMMRKHAQGILWVLHFGHSSSSSSSGTSRAPIAGSAASQLLTTPGVNVSGSGGEHVEDGAAVPPIQLGGSTSPMQSGPGTASDGGSVGDIGSHVYISVDEYENAAVKRIKGKLVGCGRQAVTLDESSTTSYIDSISSMIETASCLLLCCSLRYKESPEIRTEVEYALDLGKTLIPVVIEEGYRPDGWLASHIGNRAWLDMHHANLIDANFGRLLKEVEAYSWATAAMNTTPPASQSTSTPRLAGGLATTHRYNNSLGLSIPDNINSDRSTEVAPMTEGGVGAGTVATMATRRDHPLLQWTEDDVASWVDTLNLTNYSPHLKTFPGRYLLQLQRMNASAPEFYYQTLEKKLGLTEVSDLLNFASALAQVVELSQTVTPFDNNSIHSIAAEEFEEEEEEERKSDISGGGHPPPSQSANSKQQ